MEEPRILSPFLGSEQKGCQPSTSTVLSQQSKAVVNTKHFFVDRLVRGTRSRRWSRSLHTSPCDEDQSCIVAERIAVSHPAFNPRMQTGLNKTSHPKAALEYRNSMVPKKGQSRLSILSR